MSTTELLIVENSTEVDKNVENIFDFEQELYSISEESYEELYKLFSTWSLKCSTSIPLYEILWQDFVLPNQEKDIRLIHLLLLAQQLSNRINRLNCDRIVTGQLSERFEAVVVDVANYHGIEPNTEYCEPSLFDRIIAYAMGIVLAVPFLIDLLFSLIWKRRYSLPQDTDTVFIPGIGRIDSMKPVIEDYPNNFAVVTTPLTLAGFKNETADEEIESFDPIPIGFFCTIRIFARIIQFLFINMVRELIVDRLLEQTLADRFASHLGFPVPNTISYSLHEVNIPARFRILAYYFISQEIVNNIRCDAVVVGTGTPCGKSILAGADDAGADIYHVRHSLVTGFTPSPPFGATEFVEGTSAVDYLEEKPYVADSDQFVPAGRPYFTDFTNDRLECYSTGDSGTGDTGTHVVVATQSFSDSIRTKFVSTVLQSIDGMCSPAKVTIKTHPNEDPAFYEERFGNEDIVSVQSSGLRPLLSEADIVVTICSNVGLEGIALDAVCISANFWEPVIRSMPHYEHAESIPLLESPTALYQFFSSFEQSNLEGLRTHQRRYFEENIIAEDAANTIAEVIACDRHTQ